MADYSVIVCFIRLRHAGRVSWRSAWRSQTSELKDLIFTSMLPRARSSIFRDLHNTDLTSLEQITSVRSGPGIPSTIACESRRNAIQIYSELVGMQCGISQSSASENRFTPAPPPGVA